MQTREPTIDIDSFARRHIGPNEEEVSAMLREVGFENLDALIEAAVPKNIRLERELNLPEAKSETKALAELRTIAQKNKIARSFIGAGYYDCITPPVIQRNILENPGWYTAYTPYQAEIAQGRLEALLNFQQMIIDLTALDIANASMLDEATAAAEAMALCHAVVPNRRTFFVADNCHPQTIAVVQTRAKPLGIDIKIGDYSRFKFDRTVFGALLQYPATDGAIYDLSHRGVEVARCFLAIAPASEQRLWEQACAYPALPEVRFTKPAAPPWLAVGLLPDGMTLIDDPDRMLELGDFERCVAWALLDVPPRAKTAR